jgi:hypothetical protein
MGRFEGPEDLHAPLGPAPVLDDATALDHHGRLGLEASVAERQVTSIAIGVGRLNSGSTSDNATLNEAADAAGEPCAAPAASSALLADA